MALLGWRMGSNAQGVPPCSQAAEASDGMTFACFCASLAAVATMAFARVAPTHSARLLDVSESLQAADGATSPSRHGKGLKRRNSGTLEDSGLPTPPLGMAYVPHDHPEVALLQLLRYCCCLRSAHHRHTHTHTMLAHPQRLFRLLLQLPGH